MNDETLAYNPSEFPRWVETINGIMGSGQNKSETSIGAVRDKMADLLSTLRNPSVWRGPSAVTNLKDFKEALESMVVFINKFGNSFDEATNDFSERISKLETSNAANISVESTTYTNIQDIDEKEVQSETVGYDYSQILRIASELSEIKANLLKDNEDINNQLKRIQSPEELWNGNLANQHKQDLTNVLNENFPEIIAKLDKCISNINSAAENAKTTDQ